MSESLKRIQNYSRQLARSGKFIGWRSVAFELQFQPGYKDALQWIRSPSTQDELDRLCIEARKPNRSDSEAA